MIPSTDYYYYPYHHHHHHKYYHRLSLLGSVFNQDQMSTEGGVDWSMDLPHLLREHHCVESFHHLTYSIEKCVSAIVTYCCSLEYDCIVVYGHRSVVICCPNSIYTLVELP